LANKERLFPSFVTKTKKKGFGEQREAYGEAATCYNACEFWSLAKNCKLAVVKGTIDSKESCD